MHCYLSPAHPTKGEKYLHVRFYLLFLFYFFTANDTQVSNPQEQDKYKFANYRDKVENFSNLLLFFKSQ